MNEGVNSTFARSRLTEEIVCFLRAVKIPKYKEILYRFYGLENAGNNLLDVINPHVFVSSFLRTKNCTKPMLGPIWNLLIVLTPISFSLVLAVLNNNAQIWLTFFAILFVLLITFAISIGYQMVSFIDVYDRLIDALLTMHSTNRTDDSPIASISTMWTSATNSLYSVYRDNTWQRLPCLMIVEGDILALMAHDILPCKVRLFDNDAMIPPPPMTSAKTRGKAAEIGVT